MKKLLTVLLATISISAFAHNDMVGFDSVHSAVKSAKEQFNDVSIKEDREYGGVIYNCMDKFVYTVFAGDKFTGKVSIVKKDLDGCNIDSFWHTHGPHSKERTVFSPGDVHVVHTHGVPFYMIDGRGTIRVFSPGDSTMSPFKAEKKGFGRVQGIGWGTKVK